MNHNIASDETIIRHRLPSINGHDLLDPPHKTCPVFIDYKRLYFHGAYGVAQKYPTNILYSLGTFLPAKMFVFVKGNLVRKINL